MKLLAVIPHYNHSKTIAQVVNAMQTMQIECLIVDDGSSSEAKAVVAAQANASCQVLYRYQNGGKGAAVKDGIRYAQQHGYSHVLQVDADAQHQLTDAQKLIAAAKSTPEATVCAQPIYDNTIPKSRLYGRKITNFWLTVNTLSLDIKDGMCGFRIYPLAQTLAILEQESIGNFMDFDTELLVHLYWRGCPFIWIPTPVHYAQDGVSHFRVWQDNWLISKMHARLFFKMLRQLPCRLSRSLRT